MLELSKLVVDLKESKPQRVDGDSFNDVGSSDTYIAGTLRADGKAKTKARVIVTSFEDAVAARYRLTLVAGVDAGPELLLAEWQTKVDDGFE